MMAGMAYVEVSPEIFEKILSTHPNQSSLQPNRSYHNKKTFLAEDRTSGYAIKEDGELNHVFSFNKGDGVKAVKDAIVRGATYGRAFEGKLTEFYASFGFKEFKRLPNPFSPTGPDLVLMKL